MKGTHLLMFVNTTNVAENGAPPDKFGVVYRVLHMEFHGSDNSIDVLGLSHFGSW